jgi:hypothetical protein
VPPDRRRRSELEAIGREVRGELSRFGPQAGMVELLDAWPNAVGDSIARNAWPARIAKDGTVHVHTADSIWAFELAQRAAEIASKLGVDTVKFVPGPLPDATVEEPSPPRLEPGPQDLERARAIAASIDDEDLRETVQKAVSLSLASQPADPRV